MIPQRHLLIVVVLGGLVCFVGYCLALADWVQDIRSGVYDHNPIEAFGETSALLLYTYTALRFARRKIPL